jgi:AraC-like DNA-binding protein
MMADVNLPDEASAGRKDPLIPRDWLETEGGRPEDKFDEYWDHCTNLVDIASLDPAYRKLGVEVATWRLDNVILCETKLSPHTVSRTRKRVHNCDMRFVQLSIGNFDPGYRLIYGNRIFSDFCGVALYDFAQPHTEVISVPEECFLAYIPHAALGYEPSLHGPCIQLDVATPAGRLVQDAMVGLREEVAKIRESEAPALAAGLCGLVSGLMLRGGQGEDAVTRVKAARTRVMRDFIEANLRDPELGIAKVSTSVGASRSTIYRDFSPEGGLDHYILRRRLQRAYIDLVDQPATRGRITQVAESWGFQSMSHFYRQFRAEFGCVPGDVAPTGLIGSPEDDDDPKNRSGLRTFLSWMDVL